jgi:hypothetical protein
MLLCLLAVFSIVLLGSSNVNGQQPFLVDFVNAGATGPADQGGNDDLNNFSAGYEFTVGAADISVTDLGYYSPVEELLEDHDVAIYDVTDPAVPVASGTVTAGVTTDLVESSGDGGLLYGGFKYTAIAPVVLTAGSTYRIAGFNDGTVEGFNFASGSVVTSTEVALGTSAGDPGAVGIDYPDAAVPIGAVGCCYGPNFKYNTLPVTPIANGNTLWSVDIQGGPEENSLYNQFGDPEDKGGIEPIYGHGNVWNHFNVQGFDGATTQSDPSMELVDANGDASSLTFSINGDVQGWAGNNAWGGIINSIVPPADAAGPLSLTGDYVFFNAGQSATDVTWEISGLIPDAEYEMYVYTSVVADDWSRQLGFSIDQSGEAAVIGEPGMLFEGIVASASGTITGVAGLPIAAEQNWSGFQLRQIGTALTGDYNGNGELDAGDLDMQAIQMVNPTPDLSYDLTNDGKVDIDDRKMWVRDLKKTWMGDANLDLEFTSSDMVQVFAAGEYETSVVVGWAQGDWNGDRIFTSTDMVTAFADGGYEQGRIEAVAVPEPGSFVLVLLGLAGLLGLARRR